MGVLLWQSFCITSLHFNTSGSTCGIDASPVFQSVIAQVGDDCLVEQGSNTNQRWKIFPVFTEWNGHRKVTVVMWCHQIMCWTSSEQKKLQLFVMHLTQTLGFLSFSIFQWRIWPIWKINRAHWLGWQLWRKTNQAGSCLLWWTSVTCSPSQPGVAAHRAWRSPRALCGLAADDSDMCAAEPDTVGLHITIYQFCQACFCLVTSSMFYAFLKPNWSSCFVLLQHI